MSRVPFTLRIIDHSPGPYGVFEAPAEPINRHPWNPPRRPDSSRPRRKMHATTGPPWAATSKPKFRPASARKSGGCGSIKNASPCQRTQNERHPRKLLKNQYLASWPPRCAWEAKYLRLHCLNVFSTVFSTRFSTSACGAEITPRMRLTAVRIRLLPSTCSGPQDFGLPPAEIHQSAGLTAGCCTRIENEIGRFGQRREGTVHGG